MYHCEGDVAGCHECYKILFEDKIFQQTLNVIYMKYRVVYFSWTLAKREPEFIKIKRTNGDIEDNWKIDEDKCLSIKSREDNMRIVVYCYQDTETKLPYKIIMYRDIIKLNPSIKILIKEPSPNEYEKNILCNNVVENMKNLYEKFKSCIEMEHM